MTTTQPKAAILSDGGLGLEPKWERRYKGRFRFELEDLRSVGVDPQIDHQELQMGRLDITLEWPLAPNVVLRLRAIFPDTYPHTRPQVFLLAGLDTIPTRHISPTNGHICLLGRDSAQWDTTLTLRRLLAEQLEKAIHGTGDEDPQGEPAEVWWNQFGPKGSYCLIDSAWDLANARDGTLDLRFVSSGRHVAANSTEQFPIIEAVVSEIRDRQTNQVHKWNGALPTRLTNDVKTISVPWVRLENTILPERDLGAQIKRMLQDHPSLAKANRFSLKGSLSGQIFAVAHPVELEFGKFGIGWIFVLTFGHRHCFSTSPAQRNKKPPPRLATLPVFRAGAQDIGCRVPAVQLLREKRFLVVGTGAVGAPVVLELARNSCHTLHLIEHDSIEPGNTVRWPLGAAAWGRSKLEALQEFLAEHYPSTSVHTHPYRLGQPSLNPTDEGDEELLVRLLKEVDLVVDGSASHGVTAILAERCRERNVPLITLSATPTLEGGVVVRHTALGGCPNCLQHYWHREELKEPPGQGKDETLTQPPGCAERTFVGAGYDLQELSLQAVRLAVQTLSAPDATDSVVQTLSFVDEKGNLCPPVWRVDPLPIHPNCGCRPA